MPATALLLGLALLGHPATDVDYAGLYRKGSTYAEFLKDAGSRAETWQQQYAAATMPPEAADRLKAQPHVWRILVVADPGCSDSMNTVPHLARMVDAFPDRLTLRIVESSAGRAVMEVHRTPDGRAATPTVVLIRDDGQVRAWVERPSELQAWYVENKTVLARRELMDQKARWYAKDAGRSTLAEILDLLAPPER